MLASATGRTAIVRLLIEAGADINAKNNDGKTALKWATERNHAVVRKILKNVKK